MERERERERGVYVCESRNRKRNGLDLHRKKKKKDSQNKIARPLFNVKCLYNKLSEYILSDIIQKECSSKVKQGNFVICIKLAWNIKCAYKVVHQSELF
jgi:hypothetical protein